jgi:predicted aspartyl protease
MIEGEVNEDGVPQIPFSIAGREWQATVDSGFNGALELPAFIQRSIDAVRIGPVVSELAGGVTIVEEAFLVEVVFDGDRRRVQATFTESDGVLVGTELMNRHRLEIDFPSKSVRITKP